MGEDSGHKQGSLLTEFPLGPFWGILILKLIPHQNHLHFQLEWSTREQHQLTGGPRGAETQEERLQAPTQL